MKKHFLLFMISILTNVLFAQEKATNYVMQSIDGYVHLYFDDQYFLVDQNCEFKTYTRVIKYNNLKGGFDGFFTDYYNNNKPALTGNYKDGKKDGEFKGFYPSGELRSIHSFHNDIPNGQWQYFYSNGSPWITIEFKNQIPYVQEYWTAKGKKRVNEGKGNYNLLNETTEFSEYAYSGISFKGKLRDGRPNGIWTVFLNYGGKTEELIGSELYVKNKFIGSNYAYPENLKSNESILTLLPNFISDRSATLVSKNCTIDENKGYSQYLQNHLNSMLPQIWALKELPLKETLEVNVRVNKKGISTKIVLPTDLPQAFGEALEKAFAAVPYWIPSFSQGSTMEDILTITIAKSVDEKGATSFAYPIIKRKNEN